MTTRHAMLDMAVKGLGDLADADVVVAKTVMVNGKQIVPILALSVGFCGAGGKGKGEGCCPGGTKKLNGKGRGEGIGGMAAGGARLVPIALVVQDENGIRVLRVPKQKKCLEKLMDKIPGIVEKIQNMERHG